MTCPHTNLLYNPGEIWKELSRVKLALKSKSALAEKVKQELSELHYGDEKGQRAELLALQCLSEAGTLR